MAILLNLVKGENGNHLGSNGRPPRLPTFTNGVVLYSELIVRHALVQGLEKWEDSIETVGKYYNNLRYADDVALLTTTEDNLQQLVIGVGKASERISLSLNANKTQVLVIGRHTSSINIYFTMEYPGTR